MTVFDKFDNNWWVMGHYFIGLAAFAVFGLAAVSRKGQWIHKNSGRIFMILYGVLVFSGMLSGILYRFYDDQSIKFMLWAQSVFSVSLIVQGYSAARLKRAHNRLQRLNTPFIVFAGLMAIITLFYGGYNMQSISTSLGVMMLLILGKNLFWLRHKNAASFPWMYFHSTAMITAGLFLAFNATGFLGVHRVLDDQGWVPWGRVWISFGGFILVLAAVELYLYRRFLKAIQTKKASQN